MKQHGEYRSQGILAALQSLVIVGGCLFTATILKFMGYPDRFSELPMQLAFVRNWGFLLILIPLIWVCSTIWFERHRSEWFSKRWTVATGIGLLLALGGYMLISMGRAGSSLIQTIE